MVRRRIQLQETTKKPSQVVLRVNLVLQNHLDHRMPEIQVRIVGVFLDGDALAAASTEAAEGDGGSGLGVGVGVGGGRGIGVGEVVEGRGFGGGLRLEVEEVRELWSANVEIDGEGGEWEVCSTSRHC